MVWLVVSLREGLIRLPAAEIICLQASRNYTRIYLTGNRSLLSAKTLKEYEKRLPPDAFYRVHNGYLVNAQHIACFSRDGELQLSQAIHIKVAKRRKTAIRKQLELAKRVPIAIS
jgi:two-component system, LytTR family, response regulator